MKTQNVSNQAFAINSHFARSRGVNPDVSADTRQSAVKWAVRYCRRLGRVLRHALNRSIRFHELQTINSYRWLL